MKGVYFLQCTATGRVKIGYSSNIRRRIRKYSGMPAPVRVLGVMPGADEAVERYVHRELREYRVHGEWFEPSRPVLARAGMAQDLTDSPLEAYDPDAKTEWVGVAVTISEKDRIRGVAEIRNSDMGNLLRDNSINDLLEAARRAEGKLAA